MWASTYHLLLRPPFVRPARSSVNMMTPSGGEPGWAWPPSRPWGRVVFLSPCLATLRMDVHVAGRKTKWIWARTPASLPCSEIWKPDLPRIFLTRFRMDVFYSKIGRQDANKKALLMKTEPLILSQGRQGPWASTGGFHYVSVWLLVSPEEEGSRRFQCGRQR